MKTAILQKRNRTERRKTRVRSILVGTAQRPRMCVFRSLKHISVQLIDDQNSKTLVSAHDHEVKSKGTKTEVAKAVGELVAKKALEMKISAVIFDRGAYQYHGRVKAIADAAREAGLKF
ncbi:MAG: 50S ribosomal protein L18 [Janthinobacterium sp.]|jgi:large subunit ribosomal protein L18